MSTLIACIGEGKGTRAHVARLIEAGNWNQVFLITKDSSEKGLSPNNRIISINLEKKIPELAEELKQKLKGKILDTEVALNLVSGSGKEHMVLLTAVLKLGLGIRLVTVCDGKLFDLSFEDWEKKLAQEMHIESSENG
ncbi:hypothetical protein KY312_01395 [Candidatus Woesearchaeota archaeon]|nr:hypothetical protein [Candidatus Woesearchaeota archaeon]